QQTNEKNLAIRITQNGQPFEINKPITITPTTPPAIKAVPIKRPGSTLTEGPFSVTATLLAEYQ
ncbi:pilus assembly protein, partial [Providencia rettgeri]